MVLGKTTRTREIYVKPLPFRLETSRYKNSGEKSSSNTISSVKEMITSVNTLIERIKKTLLKLKTESAIYAKGKATKSNLTIKYRSIVSEPTILITYRVYVKNVI